MDKKSKVEKGKLAEKEAVNILKENDILCETQAHKHKFDLLTSKGKRIDVKYASKKMQPKSQKYPYYNIHTRANSKNDCDFFFIIVGDLSNRDFFIIPASDIAKTPNIRMHFPFKTSKKKPEKSKYEKYYRAISYLK